jgi:hypothetical protein
MEWLTWISDCVPPRVVSEMLLWRAQANTTTADSVERTGRNSTFHSDFVSLDGCTDPAGALAR